MISFCSRAGFVCTVCSNKRALRLSRFSNALKITSLSFHSNVSASVSLLRLLRKVTLASSPELDIWHFHGPFNRNIHVTAYKNYNVEDSILSSLRQQHSRSSCCFSNRWTSDTWCLNRRVKHLGDTKNYYMMSLTPLLSMATGHQRLDLFERESLFTITKHKHNSKPILHKLGGLPEGHAPITAGYPLLMSTKHSNVQWDKKCRKIKKKQKRKNIITVCNAV